MEPIDTISRTEAQKSFEALPDMSCFVCAPENLNPTGLNLIFEPIENGARTRFRLSKLYASYPGFVHGGVLTAVLDETMGYVGVFLRKALPMTRKLEVTYRGGVRPGGVYVCEAKVIQDRETGYTASGRIFPQNEEKEGQDLVRAHGDFSIPRLDVAKKLMGESVEMFKEYFRQN